MANIRRFLLRLFTFFRSDRAERELQREVSSHLTLLEDEYRRRGMAAGDARLAAQRALGGVDRAKEGHRDQRSFLWLEDARRDARYALRALARDRGFTCAALLTLTVGIGATTAVFGGINAVLLRPLPFPQPERLVFVFESSGNARYGASAPDFLDWRRDQGAFERMAGYASTTVTLSGSGEAERVPARRVSADYFRVLGVTPAVGRDFTEADDLFGAPRTVLVSDALWRSRFAADPALAGATLVLNGETHAVIGVLPPGVGLFERAEQFYLPLAIVPAERNSTGSRFLTVIARLNPAVSREQAQAEMVAIAARLATVRPHSNTDVTARVDDLHQTLVGDLRQPLFFFMGAAAFLLLIACANVANLQLVRAIARQREVAIRSALGAGRRRLIRQFVMESLVLAALGGAAGLILAAFSAELIPWLIPATRPRLLGAFLDWRMLAGTSIVSLATGIFFGLTPAWQMTRRDLRGQLNESPRGSTAAGRHRAGGVFAVLQIAVALLLLIGAGLSIRSFRQLQAVDPGFRLTNVLTFRLSLPEVRYGAPGQAEAFYETLLESLRTLPGVTSAAGSSSLPLRGGGVSLSATIEGRPRPDTPGAFPRFFYRGVTPDYFRTLGVPVIRGREISPDDRAGRPRAVVINQTAASRYWKDGDPIGARLEPDDAGSIVEVVGVVADTKHFGLAADLQPEMFIAIQQAPAPYWRWTQRTLDLVVHTASGASAVAGPVRETVRRLDAELPVYQLMTMDAVLAESVASPRHSMLLMLASGGIALVLAALGIYGVIAFIVAGRTQEIGVRVALGAARRDILTLVLGRSVRLCVVGLGLGLAAAIGLSRFVATFLFGVTPTDAVTYASVSALLLTIALVAAYVPARRAMRVDPVTALRGD